MDGGWFERSANFAELCHRLGKSYIVHRTRLIRGVKIRGTGVE